MGVSDLAVPKKMRAFGEAFYGRASAYDRALAKPGPSALAATLRRNIWLGDEQADSHACWLAGYVRAAERQLAEQDAAALAAGTLRFPDADFAAIDRPCGVGSEP
jgi:cytochrome b pre-mRNA-processing protein 3